MAGPAAVAVRREAFVENLERRGELGAALCVYHRGEKDERPTRELVADPDRLAAVLARQRPAGRRTRGRSRSGGRCTGRSGRGILAAREGAEVRQGPQCAGPKRSGAGWRTLRLRVQ